MANGAASSWEAFPTPLGDTQGHSGGGGGALWSGLTASRAEGWVGGL